MAKHGFKSRKFITAALAVIKAAGAGTIGYLLISGKLEADAAAQTQSEAQAAFSLISQTDGGNGPQLLDFAPLYDINPDIVAWLKIDGTAIDYPVVQIYSSAQIWDVSPSGTFTFLSC